MGKEKLLHTPGPWEISAYNDNVDILCPETYYSGIDGKHHKKTVARVYGLNPVRRRKDAELIAAAPELLEVVDDLLELVREDDNEWESRRDEFETRIRKARHVVAKVREEA